MMSKRQSAMRVLSAAAFALSGILQTAEAALIGVDFGGAAPTNWTVGTAGRNPQVLTNLIDESGVSTSVNLSYTGTAFANTALGSFTPTATQIPTHTNALTAIDGLVGDADNLNFVFSGLAAAADYRVWVFGGQLEIMQQGNPDDTLNIVSIIGSGAPVSFTQNPVNLGDLFVNGSVGSNAPLLSFALIAKSTVAGLLRIDVDDGVAGFNVLPFTAIAGLALERVPAKVPEPASIVLLTVGLLGVALAKRRRRQTNSQYSGVPVLES